MGSRCSAGAPRECGADGGRQVLAERAATASASGTSPAAGRSLRQASSREASRARSDRGSEVGERWRAVDRVLDAHDDAVSELLLQPSRQYPDRGGVAGFNGSHLGDLPLERLATVVLAEESGLGHGAVLLRGPGPEAQLQAHPPMLRVRGSPSPSFAAAGLLVAGPCGATRRGAASRASRARGSRVPPRRTVLRCPVRRRCGASCRRGRRTARR